MFRHSALAVFVLSVSNATAQQTPEPTASDVAPGTQTSAAPGPAVPAPAGSVSGATPDGPVSYALDYRASVGCPGRDEFILSVAERARSARAVTTPDVADFVVSLALAPPHSALTIQKRTGERETRVIEVDSCLEAARAAALIVAVTLDPSAATHSTRPESVAAGPSTARERSPRNLRARHPASEPRSFPPGAARASSASASRRTRRWSLELGAGEAGELRTGLTPKRVLGGSILALGGLSRVPEQSGVAWAPFVMLNVGLTQTSTAAAPGAGSASFSWMGAALSLCPARVALGARFGIHPCVAFDAGRLHAAGNAEARGIRSMATNVGVFAPGTRLWARWWLADWVDLVAAVGAAWPTRRYRYWLPTESGEPRKLYELGSPGYAAGLGLLAVRR
jgi:hypothetical protein